MAEYIYHQPVPYELDVDEVLTEVGDLPHLVQRVHIRGGHFPHRGAAEFARIRFRQERRVISALFCNIDDDEQGFRAYFATDVPLRGVLEIGYGNEVVAAFAFEQMQLEPRRLDEVRIETDFHRVTMDNPGLLKIRQ